MGVSITYGGYTFQFIKGPYSFTEIAGHLTISFQVLINKTASSSMITEEQTMLAATKLVRTSTVLSFDSNSEFTLTNGSTCFNSKCTVNKVEDASLSTLLCRLYRVTIDMDTPFNQDTGRFDGDYTITYDVSGKISATFNATYLPTTSEANAHTIAVTQGPIWSDAILATLFSSHGIVFERIHASFSPTMTNSKCSYHAIYKELATSLIGSENLFQNVSVNYSVSMITNVGRPVFNDSFTVPALLESTIHFSANALIRGTSSNINPSGVKNETSSICDSYKTYVANYIFFYLDNMGYGLYTGGINATRIVVNSYKYDFNPNTYAITAVMTVRIFQVNNSFYWYEERVTSQNNEGIAPVKLWDGQENSYVMYHTGKRTTLNRHLKLCAFTSVPVIPELPPNLFPGNILVKLNTDCQQYAESTGDTTYVGEKINLYWFNITETYILSNSSSTVDVFIRTSMDGKTPVSDSSVATATTVLSDDLITLGFKSKLNGVIIE